MGDDLSEALQLEISRPFANVVLVVATGEIDITSAAQLESEMSALPLESAVLVVIDLAGITFIDSSGINALVQAVRRVEGVGASAVLAAPTSGTQRVFEIARIADVVPVDRSRDNALARRLLAADSPRPTDGPG